MFDKNKIQFFSGTCQPATGVVKYTLVSVVLLLLITGVSAQQLKIGANITSFDSSAALEIESQKLSLLLPRIGDTTALVKTTKDGSLIYYKPGSGMNTGLYIRSGGKWNLLSPVGAGGNSWSTWGNAGTAGNLNFVGTTDNRPLLFKANNVTRLFIDSSSGNIGLGTATPAATLDNRGATLLGVKTMNDFSANGGLGLNVNTVDSFTVFVLQQTTPGISLSLPTPTNSTSGRIIFVANKGVVPITVGSLSVPVNAAVSYIWASPQWRIVGDGTSSGSFTVPNKYIAPSTFGLMQGAAENTISQDNIAIGWNALQANTTGTRNIAIGSSALRNNASSYGNVAIGSNALATGVSGKRNVAVGFRSLFNSRADSLVAVGAYSLEANTTGTGNTAAGTGALRANTTGMGNTAVGVSALSIADTAFFNTAMGNSALLNIRSSGNTGFGVSALKDLNAGARFNTAFGYNAGTKDNTQNFDAGLSNTTSLGANTAPLRNNTIILGSVLPSNAPNVGIGTYSPDVNYKLQVNGDIAGQGSINYPSDSRLKKNIRPLRKALKRILALRGVSFRWDLELAKQAGLFTDSLVHYGFIAQEVEKVLPWAVITGADRLKIKTMDYTAVVPVIAAAIKEQQPLFDALAGDQSAATDQVKQMQIQLNRIQQYANEQRIKP